MLRSRLLRATALLAAAPVLALTAAGAAAAAPSRVPCRADGTGPTCLSWTGKVKFVADGDTFDVDLDGDGSAVKYRVRMTGINAMEQHVYSKYAKRRRGECHALEATARLEGLIRRSGWRVRLKAQHAGSRSGRRLRRQVDVRVGGRWTDANALLLAEGHALWLPSGGEWAWNVPYSIIAQRAPRSHANLWDSQYCGAGPQQENAVRLWVQWDAEGADGGRHLNSEYVKLRNDGATPLDLTGWLVRDSFHRQYDFPAGTVIEPGAELLVHSGAGTASPGHLYWGSRTSLFENVTYDQTGMGDGAYLFDADGDLRASFIYPCAQDCPDTGLGALAVTVQPKKPELVTLTNHGTSVIDLDGYAVKVHAGPRKFAHVFTFGTGDYLAPGEQLQIWASHARGHDTRLQKFWGKPAYVLTDAGNAVDLRRLDDLLVDCYAWGSGSCNRRVGPAR